MWTMQKRVAAMFLGLATVPYGLSAAGLATGIYDDVAVIVNINSTASTSIADYFQAKRAIPQANMIHISAPTAEEIDSTQFEGLRTQIESYLISCNLVDRINYIVTTKGVPLRVNRGNTFSTTSASSSVESELACILGPYARYIGKPGRVLSPCYNKTRHFSRSEYGIYLVTRLDGYSVQDVYDLIGRSGPAIRIGLSAQFVFDKDPGWNIRAPYLNTYLDSARVILQRKGFPVEINGDSVYLTGRSDVLGYVSWGSNDSHAAQYTQNAVPRNSWLPGAIVETYVSTSGRSFESPPTYGQSLIADLLAEGVSGAKGYVYEPFSSSMTVAYILFDRYTSGFNIAESFFMSSFYISWMDVVVGDPKTSITLPPLPLLLPYYTLTQQPDGHGVAITWEESQTTASDSFVVQRRRLPESGFTDVSGSVVASAARLKDTQRLSWVDRSVATGTYAYRLRQVDPGGREYLSTEELITIESIAGVQPGARAGQFKLHQNYPNPFNPATTISYETSHAGRVVLRIYTYAGAEVATLINEQQQAGPHSVLFSAGQYALASGVYYCRVQAEERTLTQRMILIK